MVGEIIKELRDANGMTLADLARKLGITRSSVNAWEMGISAPSTQYIVDLANLFKVSTDYLLGISFKNSISIDGLVKEDVNYVYNLVTHLRKKNANINKNTKDKK